MDREQALDTALGQIERQFGKGSVMKMTDAAAVNVGSVSTGSLSLDLALGIGGLPRGRVVEIFGPESSGKTTLVYHVIAEAQRRGGICAFIDAEHAMDPAYAKRIGVNIDDLLVSQPDTGEQALEICELLIRSGALDVVAIDSVAALTPKAEIEGEMGDSLPGIQARLMSQALRKLAGTLNRTDTICIFTNQLREKIGVMFGSPEVTPGGRALKFYASIRLDIRRIETLKEGVEAIGNRVRVKVVKNKVAPPFKQAEFDIIYGSGISWEGTVVEAGVDKKVIQKSGSYFSFDDERLGQGRHNAAAFLREHPDVTQKILGALQREAGPDQVVSARLLPIAEGDAAPAAAEGRRAGGRAREGGQRAREGQRAGVMPVVSGLRELPSGRVAVELDGARWRTVPGGGRRPRAARRGGGARPSSGARARSRAAPRSRGRHRPPGGLAPRAVHGRARPPAPAARVRAGASRGDTRTAWSTSGSSTTSAMRCAGRSRSRSAARGTRRSSGASSATGSPGRPPRRPSPPCRPSGSARGSSWPRRAPGSGRHASSPGGASARTRSRRRLARSLRTRPEAR